MPFPSDVLLPLSAKYYGFIEKINSFNTNWDITWSFTFALTGIEHGFCTFLSTYNFSPGAYPGHYLGYLGSEEFILTETPENLLSEDSEKLISNPSGNLNGVLGIAFDSTGFFALSNTVASGIPLSAIKKNSLIIRDVNNNVVLNRSLSSLDNNFFIASSAKNYQTLRFRLTNAGRKLYIDYKSISGTYSPLLTTTLSTFNASDNPYVYAGLSFCSPVSSSSITPSTMWIKNFNVEGSSIEPTYEILPYESIYPRITTFTTFSNISSL